MQTDLTEGGRQHVPLAWDARLTFLVEPSDFPQPPRGQSSLDIIRLNKPALMERLRTSGPEFFYSQNSPSILIMPEYMLRFGAFRHVLIQVVLSVRSPDILGELIATG
jgi:hypothetical protein